MLVLWSLIEDDLCLTKVLGGSTIHVSRLRLLAYFNMGQLLLFLQSILQYLLASHDLLSVLDITISLPTELLLESHHIPLSRSRSLKLRHIYKRLLRLLHLLLLGIGKSSSEIDDIAVANVLRSILTREHEILLCLLLFEVVIVSW